MAVTEMALFRCAGISWALIKSSAVGQFSKSVSFADLYTHLG